MPELVETGAQHDAMMQSFSDAEGAVPLADRDRIELGDKTIDVASVPGEVTGPSVMHSLNERGETPVERVVGSTSKHGEADGQRTMSTYDSRVEWADDPSEADGSVTVRRTDSRGETYQHTFSRPDSARKFNTLIGSQVADRITDKAA